MRIAMLTIAAALISCAYGQDEKIDWKKVQVERVTEKDGTHTLVFTLGEKELGRIWLPIPKVDSDTSDDKLTCELVEEKGGHRLVVKFNDEDVARIADESLESLFSHAKERMGKIELNGEEKDWTILLTKDGLEEFKTMLLKRGKGLLPDFIVNGNAAVTTEVKSVNGKSRAKVTIDGKVVYDGPGSNAKAEHEEHNGKKFTVVTVDGKVVYKAGEKQKVEEKEKR